jgi:16S rRNA (cytosine967-C5)-methyltransferase
MRFDNQLRHALGIIDTYAGEVPLHAWLKDFFRANKQMGGRDRRLLSTMAYGFYRLGHALRGSPAADRMLAGLFLCNDGPIELLQHFRPDWDPVAPLADKIAATGIRVADIFPWKDELCAGIDHESFCLSFLRQPDLYLRIRPGHQEAVLQRLGTMPHRSLAPSAVCLPNGFRVEDFFTPDREVVVQDYSSQRVAGYLFEPSAASLPDPSAAPRSATDREPGAPRSFWDACAASGGKSILAHDLHPDMEITVSDIRESVLYNLRSRFRTAGIGGYRSFLIDLSVDSPPKEAAAADLVLTDVPCTGSGTWSRTPEQLYFFQPSKIGHYAALQKKILGHVVPCLAPQAALVYCTCSVFKKENEEITTYVSEELGMRLQRSGPIAGYEQRADTLFAARFTR